MGPAKVPRRPAPLHRQSFDWSPLTPDIAAEGDSQLMPNRRVTHRGGGQYRYVGLQEVIWGTSRIVDCLEI
jgi:hypothetical protein